MSNSNDKALNSAQNHKNSDDKTGKGASDFVIGLVTFIVFIFFMTAWMYFSV